MIRVRLKVMAGSQTAEWREFDAPSIEEGVRLAARNGLRVVAIDEPAKATVGQPRGKFDLLLFTQELLALLDAGLNVVEALETLRKKESAEAARIVLDQLIEGLREGLSLSAVLARFPAIFPSIYVAGVVASERTGMLSETLARFVAYQLQLNTVRKKVISSAIYPAMLMTVGVLVTVFLLGYVVPRFSVVLESSGNKASDASRLLLQVGAFIGHHQAAVWSFFLSSIIAIAGALSVQAVRGRLLEWFVDLPVCRQFFLLLSLARFYRTVALLLDAGIPLLKALDMSATLLTANATRELAGIRERIRSGMPLSVAMEKTSLLTPIAESLIKVGERSGKLAEMMERIARFLDEELARRVDWFSRLFEPLLMTALGLIIGLVVVLMYMPIFDLVGNFQ